MLGALLPWVPHLLCQSHSPPSLGPDEDAVLITRPPYPSGNARESRVSRLSSPHRLHARPPWNGPTNPTHRHSPCLYHSRTLATLSAFDQQFNPPRTSHNMGEMGDADMILSSWKLVEAGRVTLRSAGPHVWKIAVTAQIIDHGLHGCYLRGVWKERPSPCRQSRLYVAHRHRLPHGIVKVSLAERRHTAPADWSECTEIESFVIGRSRKSTIKVAEQSIVIPA